MIRVVQTHTVWFERPFLLRLGTLLPDYTILGKLDFRSRTPRPDSEAGLTRNWAISQFVSKYTVLFLEPIRSQLDPFRVSHTIIGTSDSPRLTSEAGLPKPDSLRIGLSPNSSPNTRFYSLNQSVHYWILFGCPTLLLGRRTTGKGIGANTHHCVSISDRMAGWPSSQLSE